MGTVFTLALAIGILLVPEPDLLEALFGDITAINLTDTIIAVMISIIVISLTRVIYKKIILSLISEELAASRGIKIGRINLLCLLLVSLVVAIGIKFTGTLLVGFLVVTPAAAAKTISSNTSRYFILGAVFGAICSFSGILMTVYLNEIPGFNVPAGPLVLIAGIIIFSVAVIIRHVKK